MKEIKIRVINNNGEIIREENVETDTANVLVISYDKNKVTSEEADVVVEKLIESFESNVDPIVIEIPVNNPISLERWKLE